ncbi:MAG: hypothetical protein KC502_20530 [Myxococcales bacterium]|nr:hypothetical protein [Myxococcales bacterium]
MPRSTPRAHQTLLILHVLPAMLSLIPLTGCETDPATMTDADCQRTYWCTDKGRCFAKGEDCVAKSASDCTASTECKTKGRCELSANACHEPKVQPCATSVLCTKNGYCQPGKAGTCCNTTGWCCSADGKCSNS